VAVTIYKPADPTLLIVFGQIPVKHLPPQVMQKMLIENRNHSKYTAPVLSLSDNLDAIEVHFKLTQSELEAAENVMDRLVGSLEYWRDYLVD
jgi:hypothetical protein